MNVSTVNTVLPTLDRAQAEYMAARELLELGQPLEALDRISSARSLFLAAGDKIQALRTDLGRINVLDDLGRHTEAVSIGKRLLHSARDLRPLVDESQLDMIIWIEAAASENLGASLGWLGHHEAAATSLQDAANTYRTVGSPFDEARVIANLGVEHLELGDYREAERLFQQAEPTLVANGELLLAQRCVVYEAQAHALAGCFGKALDALLRAEHLTSTEGLAGEPTTTDYLRHRLARAEVFATLNLWPEVLEHCERLDIELAERPLLRDIAQLEVIRSRALIGTGDKDAAELSARRAVQLLDELQLHGRAAKARLILARCIERDEGIGEIAAARAAFTSAGEEWGIAACAILSADLATTASDRNKWLDQADAAGAARYPNLLWRLDFHRGRRALDLGSDSDAELCLERSLATLRTLRDAVTDRHRQIPFMEGRRDPLEALVELRVSAGRLQEAFETTAAERSWALSISPDPTSRPAPSGAGQTILYQSIADRLSAFISGGQSSPIEHVALNMTLADLDDCKRRLAAQWRRLADPRMRVHLDSLRSATESILQELYLGIFQPIDERLTAGPSTIVPTGQLAGIPFHALHDGVGYLVERCELALAPSTRMSIVDSGGVDARTLIVGVPDAAAPDIALEAERIAEVTGGHSLLGREATIGAVRELIADHDIIHFACHSVFRPENPQLSAIRLADGWLRAIDLFDWPLANAMIVMASCSSGQQGTVGEDELLGLPRSFLAAGATSVVMNLWPVDDVASVGLMAHFHSALRVLKPAAALRSAQLAALDLHEHPYLWAPTVAYGTRTNYPQV